MLSGMVSISSRDECNLVLKFLSFLPVLKGQK